MATDVYSEIEAMRARMDARDLLIPLDDADLYRYAGDGFEVRAWYRPCLQTPERATVEVSRYGASIDALDVPASDALEVWRHVAAHSELYADAIADAESND